MRVYDPRAGRFLSVDPVEKNYAMLSPFQYASNRPVDGKDLDGLEYLPYGRSMYHLLYTTSTTNVPGISGNSISMTTESTVVKIVYDNIPAALRDPQTNSFKFVSGGPVTAYGRDWDEKTDGPLLYNKGRYYNDGPGFNGLPPGSAPDPTPATKPVGKEFDDDVNVTTTLGKVGTAFAGLKEGFEMKENLGNMSTWDAGNAEFISRKGFYKATNLLGAYLSADAFVDKTLTLSSSRVDLVNFLTDGVLRTDLADNLKNEWKNNIYYDYSSIRKANYGNALKIANAGLQILSQQGIKIRPETVNEVNRVFQQYKENGGGNEYDDIKKLTKPD
jgi:hypothetical protein